MNAGKMERCLTRSKSLDLQRFTRNASFGACSLAILLASGRAEASPSQFQVIIDASNPAAVTFSGTLAPALANSTGQGFAVVFEGSLLGSPQLASFATGNFAATQSNYRYGVLSPARPNVVSPDGGLRLTCCGNQTQTFIAGQPAFSGLSTFNLSAFPIATTGRTGNILVSDDNGNTTATVVGQYSYTVPGPLPVLGAGAAFCWSRKLRKRLKHSKPEMIPATRV
jgi:hypothetical protein